MKLTCYWRKVCGRCYYEAMMREKEKYTLCKKRIHYVNGWIEELKKQLHLAESKCTIKSYMPYLDGYSWIKELQGPEGSNKEMLLSRGCPFEPTKCELDYGMMEIRLRGEVHKLEDVLSYYNQLVQLINSCLIFCKQLKGKKGSTYMHFSEKHLMALFYWYDHREWPSIKNVSAQTEGIFWVAERGYCTAHSYPFEACLQPSKKALEGTAFMSNLEGYMLQVILVEECYEAEVIVALMEEAYALMTYLNYSQKKKQIGGVWMAIDKLSKGQKEKLAKKGSMQGFRCMGRVSASGCYEENRIFIKRNKGY